MTKEEETVRAEFEEFKAQIEIECGAEEVTPIYAQAFDAAMQRMIQEHGLGHRHQPYIAPKVPGRNEPCSCGSEKKYKKCCL